MTVELPPETEHDATPTSSGEPTVDDLLRALMVHEVNVRVDPITGRAIPDGEQATQDQT